MEIRIKENLFLGYMEFWVLGLKHTLCPQNNSYYKHFSAVALVGLQGLKRPNLGWMPVIRQSCVSSIQPVQLRIDIQARYFGTKINEVVTNLMYIDLVV